MIINDRYVRHDTLIWEYLNSSIHLVCAIFQEELIFGPLILFLMLQAPYLEKKLRKIYEGEAYKFYRQSDKVPPVVLIETQKLTMI